MKKYLFFVPTEVKLPSVGERLSFYERVRKEAVRKILTTDKGRDFLIESLDHRLTLIEDYLQNQSVKGKQ